LVCERIDGDVMEVALKKSNLATGKMLLQLLFETISKLHEIEGICFENSPDDGYRHKSWKLMIENRVSIISNKIKEKNRVQFIDGFKALGEIPDYRFIPRLTHFDLHLENVIYGVDGNCYLIDFIEARFSDPLWDFLSIRESLDKINKELAAYWDAYILSQYERRHIQILRTLRRLRSLLDDDNEATSHGLKL
jgi:aminoglycoside phosphotransferase (APT) family kinase protein